MGCNAGRNLDCLYQGGFKQLEAIEINTAAIDLLNEQFPEMAQDIHVYNGPIEEVVPDLPAGSYDLVFSMAVLEHVHTDSEWVFEKVVDVVNDYLVTIEDERCLSSRHFPRNYQAVFEGLGLEQVRQVEDLSETGLPSGFVARVFRK